MSRRAMAFTCAECGATHAKWAGRCDACGAWNTIAEEADSAAGPTGRALGTGRGRRVELSDLAAADAPLERRRKALAAPLRRVVKVGGVFVDAASDGDYARTQAVATEFKAALVRLRTAAAK